MGGSGTRVHTTYFFSMINFNLHGYSGLEGSSRLEDVREKIYSGKWGYNPHKDTLHLLKEPASVSDKDKKLSLPYGGLDTKNISVNIAISEKNNFFLYIIYSFYSFSY